MTTTRERITIHRPGADNMTLIERINHISLHGTIRVVCLTHKSATNELTGALIAWNENITNPLKQLNSGQ